MSKLLTRSLPRTIPMGDAKEARQAWYGFRIANGRKAATSLLTHPDGNAKLHKAAVPTYGLSLAPASESGFNVCPKSTPECRRGCVSFAGRGEAPSVQAGRILRTEWFAADPGNFVTLLAHEIGKAVKRHGEIGMRLNTFSDLPWHTLTPWLFEMFPDVHFYDYTKVWTRVDEDIPSNWHITYSASERTTTDEIREMVRHRENVAVVFKGKTLPTHMQVNFGPLPWSAPVADGNVTDARWLDPAGVVVGLNAKGRMRYGDWKMARTA